MFRLLIAEDELETCENMIACIDWGRYGFEIVGVANDGASAYKMIYEKDPDIVLIDIRMPVMTGLDVIRRVRDENVLFPSFIIISGYDTFTYAQTAIHLKVDGYLLKPFNPDQLLLKLQETISRTAFVSQMITGEYRGDVSIDGFSRELSDHGCIHYPNQQEQAIIGCIRAGDAQTLPGLVDDFLNVANTNNPSIYKYYHCFLILYAGICRVLSSYGLSIKPLRGLEDLNYANADSSIRKALHEVSFSALSMIHSTSAPSQIIREVIDYLRNRYADKLTLSDIAEHVHITPVYLSNLFSKSMNITLTGYIQQLRVEAAKPLLEDLNNSIADIACQVGYPDVTYFSQVFKRLTGVSPNAYRNWDTLKP